MSVTNIFSRQNTNTSPTVTPTSMPIATPIETPVVKTSSEVVESPIQPIQESVREDVKDSVKESVQTSMLIESHPISSKNGIITGKKALFVGDNNINIVSDRYKIVQPNDVIAKFEAASNLKINVCSVNSNTGGLLLSAKFEDFSTDQSNHTCSLSFYPGHNGAHRTVLALQALNHACHNQVPMLLACKSRHLISHKHLETFDFDLLEQIICSIPDQIKSFKESYDVLNNTKYTKKQFLNDFAEQFKIDVKDKNYTSKMDNVSRLYDSADGQRGLTNDSAYKAFQAITNHLTHSPKKTANRMETVNMKNQDLSHKWYQTVLLAA